MLSFFDSLTVPGLEKVTVYRRGKEREGRAENLIPRTNIHGHKSQQ